MLEDEDWGDGMIDEETVLSENFTNIETFFVRTKADISLRF